MAILKVWYRLEFKQVFHVLVVDERLCLGIIAFACADVAIEYGIGKSEVVLIGLSTEAVGRRFFYQIDGQP